jgi:hypothetical protein
LTPGRSAPAYLILSAIGAVFIILIAWLGYSESRSITLNDKLIVGGAFIASCLFGASLALRPGWIRRSSRARGHAYMDEKQGKYTKNMIGHHPDCSQFRSHVVQFRGRRMCAGCSGLALGSIVAIVLTIVYVALPVTAEVWELQVVLIVGMAFVAMGFADIILSLGISAGHNQINMYLVIGFHMVVISVHQFTGRVAFSLIAIIIAFLWLDTRIQLSSKRHKDICKACDQMCKAY